VIAELGGTAAVVAGQLKSVIERIERLEEDKAVIAGDIKEVYTEAKGNGFDTKILKAIIRLRKLSTDERNEQQSLIDVYMAALGMTGDETGEAK